MEACVRVEKLKEFYKNTNGFLEKYKSDNLLDAKAATLKATK